MKKAQSTETQTMIRKLRFFRKKINVVQQGHEENPIELIQAREKDIQTREVNLLKLKVEITINLN